MARYKVCAARTLKIRLSYCHLSSMEVERITQVPTFWVEANSMDEARRVAKFIILPLREGEREEIESFDAAIYTTLED